jgi:cytoskeleton protein RodZ
MNSVGELLRRERESQGRQIAEIAEELCITQRYLRAIEQDDLDSLPASFFYKSFVKQYAAILGVDEKKLQPGVDALIASEEPLPSPGHYRYSVMGRDPAGRQATPSIRHLDPIVQDGNRRHFSDPRLGLSLVGLGVVLLVCTGFYAWWNKVPQVRVTAQAVAEQTRAPVAVEVKAAEPLERASGEPQESTIDLTTSTGSDGLNHVVLNLSATEKTWLSISTSDGKRIFSGILEPSQTKTLTGLEVARMKVGNAGGLEVHWNGKAIGPIGPRGQVRVVLFTPENFQILGPSEAL